MEEIINQDALKRLNDWGGADLIQQMLRLFLENAPERINQIRAAFDDDPGGVPERGAHSLKSSAANVGAEGLRAIALRMEHAASEGDLESVRKMFPQLEAAFEEAKTELEQILAGYTE